MEYVPAKTIVTRTKTREWFGYDYNMNIYRGCNHGCIYCDSRSECYHIDDFDTVKAKENALEIIRDDLRRKVKSGVVGTGAMSDPYNPFEKELNLTANALTLIDAFHFGCGITTKSDLIVRDIDILESIAEHSPVIAKLTITTCDDSLSRKLESHAPVSSRRFEAIHQLSKRGIYAGVIMMPILPFIEDTEENVMGIVNNAIECGAKFIYPAFGMTLRQNQREWYLNKLEQIFPDSDLRRKYEKHYGCRYQCTSPRAKKLWEMTVKACENAGLQSSMSGIIRAYKKNYQYEQLSLF